jgi:hypothetical protein
VDTPDLPTSTERRPKVTLWLLRITGTAQLAVLGQPVLAGLFLTGDVDAIEIHSAMAILIGLIDLALVLAALAYVLMRGRLWVLPTAVVLWLAVVMQTVLGYAREVGAHIPLGVAIVVTSVLVGIGVWRPATARPRSRR